MTFWQKDKENDLGGNIGKEYLGKRQSKCEGVELVLTSKTSEEARVAGVE